MSEKRTAAKGKFTPEEKAAMRERARELKAEAQKADGEKALLAKVAEMPAADRALAERVHAIVKASAPDPRAEDLVRNARIRQGRQDPLLLPERGEVQLEVRNVRLHRRGEPRQGRHVADLVRAQEADGRRGEEDQRAREASGAVADLL